MTTLKKICYKQNILIFLVFLFTMQVYAIRENKERVFVEAAERGRDYFCFECGQKVRLRGGPHVQLHFYHIDAKSMCRLHTKSEEHIVLQNYIQKHCGGEQEVRFSVIGRIADVYVAEMGLVVEIQCSPIKAEEVKERIRDYGSLGYRVIWILYDGTFNKRRASAAEVFLEGHTHYYGEVKSGRAAIYDQCSLIHRGLRRFDAATARQYLCYFSVPRKFEAVKIDMFAFGPMKKRAISWSHHISGDLLDEANSSAFFMEELAKKEQALLAPYRQRKKRIRYWWERICMIGKNVYFYIIEKSAVDKNS